MRTLIAALALLALAGCTTGRDFQRPAIDTFRLGTVKRADIVAAYGEPRNESNATVAMADVKLAETQNRMNGAPVPGSFRKMVYAFNDRSERLYTNMERNKFMIFVLWNDQLVSYNFTSDFNHDSTDFDSSLAGQLVAGKTTRQDLVSLLGEPTGRTVYPFIQRQDDEKWIYHFLGMKDGKVHDKMLQVLLGPDGVVADFRLGEESAPAPRPAPGPATVPIFIPSK